MQKMENAILQLQQQNQELRQEIQKSKTDAAVSDYYYNKVDQSASNSWASFVSPFAKDKKFVLGGYIQANAEFGNVDAYRGSLPGGPNGVNNRFRLRRARLGAWGDLNDDFDFKIMGDFAQGDGINSGNGGGRTAFSGTDLFINYHHFDEANIKIGQFDTPFGMEQFMIPDMFTLTPERSAVTEAMRPERQIGVMLWGKPLANLWPEQKDLVAYWFGIFNGNDRNITANDNGGFMYMGRIEVQPFKGKFLGQPTKWNIGIDGYYSCDATNVLLTQTGNILQQADGSLKSLTSSGTGHGRRMAQGIDQRLEWGPVTLQAEYLQTQYVNEYTPTGLTPAQFTAKGYWALVAYQFVPQKWEVVGKYEYLDPGQIQNGDLRTVTAGINYYPKGRESRDIVLMLDWLHTWSHFRADYTALYGGADQFDEIMLRAECNF
jgi:hypothetical protein